MELKTLNKPQHVTGKNGLWGTFNNVANLTCSQDGYMLAITKPEIGRLDDMTQAEEEAYWDFSFSQAESGLRSPANRAVHPDDIVQSTKPCSVAFALNDGIGAWQNVGTTHGHIVWTTSPDKIGDMQARLKQDRRLFSGDASTRYLPLATETVKLSTPYFTGIIRNARHSMRKAFGNSLSFSLYTQEPARADPRNGTHMVIEAWSKEHHSIGSLSQFIRYWHKLYESPVTVGGPGLRFAGFTHD